jgi:hypothetical protein
MSSDERLFTIGDECSSIASPPYQYLLGDTRRSDVARKGINLGASVIFIYFTSAVLSLLWNMIIPEDNVSQVLRADRSDGPKIQESSAMCRIERVTR